MSDNRLQINGLAELSRALLQLPADLTDDAADIVDDAAEVTSAQLIQSYPLGDTGNLRGGVRVEQLERARAAVAFRVRSTSPHAHLWEFGTQNIRYWKGWSRGKMPSHEPQGLVPIAQRNRRRMVDRLIQLVERAGLTVTGRP